MDSITEENEIILDTDFIEIQEDGKQYYLVETFKQEQVVGSIQEEKIGSTKFIRVNVPPRYGYTAEYSKYLAANTVASLTPISKATAIKFIKNILSTESPVNKSFSFPADFSLNSDLELSNVYKSGSIKENLSRKLIPSHKGIRDRLLGAALMASIFSCVSISEPSISIESSFWFSLSPVALLLILLVIEYFE